MATYFTSIILPKTVMRIRIWDPVPFDPLIHAKQHTFTIWRELECAMKEVARLQKIHRNPSSGKNVHPDLMNVRHSLGNCVSKHKSIYSAGSLQT
jgi:hypothetical protein